MNKKKIAINILSIIGLILSIYLCKVFINANFLQGASPSACAINAQYDCDKVAQSPFSQFFGIPLSLWGVILYLFFLFMNNIEKLQTKKFLGFLQVFKNPNSYMYVIGIIAFTCSILLALISKLVIESVCIVCVMTYFINLAIALVAKEWGAGVFFELKNSVKDFIDAIKQPKYTLAFLVVVLFAGSIIYFLDQTKILTPNVRYLLEQKRHNENIRIKEPTGNTLGNEDATLIIHEYMDFNCGGCMFANMYLHRIASEFDNVKVIQHNLPLERACNHNMQFDGHKNSCLKTKYALAAKKQDKYWVMSNILFFAQDIKDENDILKVAKSRHFDVKKLQEDANSEEIAKELKDGILEADSKGVNVTPTIFVGMRKIEGLIPYPEFEQAVIEQGGKKKQQ